jgi:hypothetical protein
LPEDRLRFKAVEGSKADRKRVQTPASKARLKSKTFASNHLLFPRWREVFLQCEFQDYFD